MSRQLNAWVAEYVMGWYAGTNLAGEDIWVKDKATIYTPITYSSDMNAAMEVVGKFDSMSIDNYSSNKMDVGGVWDVVIIERREIEAIAAHDSLPVAICLAALRAVGKDELVDEYLKTDSEKYIDEFIKENQELMDKLED